MTKFIITFTLLSYLAGANPALAEDPSANKNPPISTAEKVVHYFVDGASISVGTGVRAISLEAKRLNTEDRGKLVDAEEATFLSYNLKASYLAESNFGYSWMFNLSSFELKQQEIAPDVYQNLGTQVRGYFAYAVPAFFYNLGDKHNGSHFRAGIGLGLGVTEFKGDIILTESSKPDDHVYISNGPSNLFIAGGIFIEGQLGYFTMRIATAGPSLEYEGYEITISDTSIMLGLTIPFD